eukprot:TRINITY_DN1100_c0_g1_i1.p4 TRINITY_DN1100_c0_g1~~TRINITY_DN1100_c0_g1_i1.p4  ORF type:complete len:151 (+),score=67.79 TRINITY_DN1100_c0_g1_i1:383-835(+)
MHAALPSPTTKNFVDANKTEALRDVPKKKLKEEFNYLQKKDYGEVPGYLHRVQQEIVEEKEYLEMQERERRQANFHGPKVRELSEEEKQDLVTALKAKWEKIRSVYVKMPMTVDTISQRMKKEEMENQMTSIEKDITALSKQHVYVHEEE